MNLFKNLLRKKDFPINSYNKFWKWFQANEKLFFEVLKEERNIEENFFDQLSQKLNELKDGYWFLAGMYDENTAELVLTADGVIKNIFFVEEIVRSAPEIARWKITALKPALDIKDVNIEMADYKFNKDKINFYSNENSDYPDEIDITIVYDDYTEKDKDSIANGIYIFLDNFLGELNFATAIDNLKIIPKDKSEKEIIPIEKLTDFLNWRQMEFVEKYDGIRYNTEKDNYASLTAELENGNPLIAVINTSLLNWENKASHPWILRIEIHYKGNLKGMPDDGTYKQLDDIEGEIMSELKDYDGYLNVGRQTANNQRIIYFACKDFRKPSQVIYQIQDDFATRFKINYDIYKDKYWRSLNRFNPRH